MTSRIPVSPDTHRRVKGYVEGLGGSFDDAINYLLDYKIGDKASWPAGDDDRRNFMEWLEKKDSNKTKK